MYAEKPIISLVGIDFISITYNISLAVRVKSHIMNHLGLQVSLHSELNAYMLFMSQSRTVAYAK
jgi:hypothetical protein